MRLGVIPNTLPLQNSDPTPGALTKEDSELLVAAIARVTVSAVA